MTFTQVFGPYLWSKRPTRSHFCPIFDAPEANRRIVEEAEAKIWLKKSNDRTDEADTSGDKVQYMDMLLTVEQAAQRLQVTPNTVREQLRTGKLRGTKHGRMWRVPESALVRTSPGGSPTPPENPLARALAMIEARDSKAGKVKQQAKGVTDAASELRNIRARSDTG
jgi:excisionase family DNA binding protein